MEVKEQQMCFLETTPTSSPGSIIFTHAFPEDAREEIKDKIKQVCYYLPELSDTTVKVGHTTRRGAHYCARECRGEDFEYFRIGKRAPPYTIAHELMHGIQRMVDDIPTGERACDIWTLARVGKHFYRTGRYVDIPSEMDNAPEIYGEVMQKKAREAIEKRDEGVRQYIVWFEEQLEEYLKEEGEKDV